MSARMTDAEKGVLDDASCAVSRLAIPGEVQEGSQS